MSTTQIVKESVEQNEVTYWETVSESKWGSYISAIEKRAILKAHSFSQQASQALEIGCEGGRWSRLLNDTGWKMTCVDINPKTLSLCQRRLPSARCVLVDPSNAQIPCETGSMGVLLCIEVSPVMPDSNWFVDEARRVLRPGGMIVGTFYNRLSYRGFLAHATASFRGVHDYYRHSYPAWRRTLRRRGFIFLHEEGLCWFPFRRASNSMLIPGSIMAEQYLGLRRLVTLSPWVVFVAQKSNGRQLSFATSRKSNDESYSC